MAGLSLRGLLLLLFSGLLAAPAPAQAPDPPQAYLIRGAFADGRLWLLTESGTLLSVAEDSQATVPETLPEPVLDLCRSGGAIVILTGQRGGGRAWTVRRRAGGAWRIAGQASRRGDRLIAMDCSDGLVTLLTSERIVEMRRGGPHDVALADDLPHARVNTALFGTPRHLYLGLNSGEWGGGLRRIDRRNGAIVTIERSTPEDRCRGGPLNSACDPVHAIAAEPWRPECVIVAIGLVHFMSHGRLVEVCGERVEALYSSEISDADFAGSSTAFFGLARVGDSLRAVGIDGVYRLSAGGAVERSPFPRWRRIGDVALSFDLPDVVLVVTQVNRRASVSGGAPMIVPR